MPHISRMRPTIIRSARASSTTKTFMLYAQELENAILLSSAQSCLDKNEWILIDRASVLHIRLEIVQMRVSPVRMSAEWMDFRWQIEYNALW